MTPAPAMTTVFGLDWRGGASSPVDIARGGDDERLRPEDN